VGQGYPVSKKWRVLIELREVSQLQGTFHIDPFMRSLANRLKPVLHGTTPATADRQSTTGRRQIGTNWQVAVTIRVRRHDAQLLPEFPAATGGTNGLFVAANKELRLAVASITDILVQWHLADLWFNLSSIWRPRLEKFRLGGGASQFKAAAQVECHLR
jgi:hypothetical protein